MEQVPEVARLACEGQAHRFYQRCYGLLVCRCEESDIRQEIYLSFTKKKMIYSENLRILRRLAWSACVDYLRKVYPRFRRHGEAIFPEPIDNIEPIPVSNWDQIDAHLTIAALMLRLPSRLNLVVNRGLLGHTDDSTAKTMGITPSRISQIRKEAITLMKRAA